MTAVFLHILIFPKYLGFHVLRKLYYEFRMVILGLIFATPKLMSQVLGKKRRRKAAWLKCADFYPLQPATDSYRISTPTWPLKPSAEDSRPRPSSADLSKNFWSENLSILRLTIWPHSTKEKFWKENFGKRIRGCEMRICHEKPYFKFSDSIKKGDRDRVFDILLHYIHSWTSCANRPCRAYTVG